MLSISFQNSQDRLPQHFALSDLICVVFPLKCSAVSRQTMNPRATLQITMIPLLMLYFPIVSCCILGTVSLSWCVYSVVHNGTLVTQDWTSITIRNNNVNLFYGYI